MRGWHEVLRSTNTNSAEDIEVVAWVVVVGEEGAVAVAVNLEVAGDEAVEVVAVAAVDSRVLPPFFSFCCDTPRQLHRHRLALALLKSIDVAGRTPAVYNPGSIE